MRMKSTAELNWGGEAKRCEGAERLVSLPVKPSKPTNDQRSGYRSLNWHEMGQEPMICRLNRCGSASCQRSQYEGMENVGGG